jgi:phage terminase large subunit-like protein
MTTDIDSDLSNLSVEELQSLGAKLAEKEATLKRHGAFPLFKPLWYQKEWFDCEKKIIALLCGNQVGKTEFGAVRVLSTCLGCKPVALGGQPPQRWEDLQRPGIRALVCGENFTTAIPKTILPKLQRYITDQMLSRQPKKNAGNKLPEVYFFRSGAELHIQSYDQAVSSFEGPVWDIVWFDEPPPQAIFTAVRRGTMSKQGVILITATPLKEPWMHDQIVIPSEDEDDPMHDMAAVFRADIEWNCKEHHKGFLPHAEIQSFLASLPKHERIARERGEFLDLSGLEFSYLKRETHVCPDLW